VVVGTGGHRPLTTQHGHVPVKLAKNGDRAATTGLVILSRRLNIVLRAIARTAPIERTSEGAGWTETCVALDMTRTVPMKTAAHGDSPVHNPKPDTTAVPTGTHPSTIRPVVGRPSSRPPAPTGTLRPDLAGSRRLLPGSTSVFLVDPDGYRRAVPNSVTYNRLFRSWQGAIDDPDLEGIAERPGFSTSVMLIRGDLSTILYLLDHGLKRCIPGPAMMDKYWFNWDRIEVLKQFLVDTIPSGRPWL
jgi:hypothetical protein